MVIVLTSPAFRGYTRERLSNYFSSDEIQAEIDDDTVTITVAEINGLSAGQKLVAVWKLSVGAHKLQVFLDPARVALFIVAWVSCQWVLDSCQLSLVADACGHTSSCMH